MADELTCVLDAAAIRGDPVADLRAMAGAYRGFAHANPVTYTLMMAPPAVPGATARSVRSSATFLSIVEQVAGPRHALPAARTIVAWAHGFITMELAGAFRLGGDVEQAWDFGLSRILSAIRRPAAEASPGEGAGGRDG